ncbi:MAG: leucine-rich repeat domain-containing protein, partial [Lachnospiraceae bacterium]|nr:leucine-rich repeat domain-containing protein [Lachnospiraceae bacterium]
MKKVMQKFVLCLMFVFGTMVLVGTDAKAELKNGKCGDNVTYSFDSDTRVLTISGEGPMKDYVAADILKPSSKASPFSIAVSPNDMINSVVIENGVTSIGNYAFNTGYLKSITIPDSVTSIGTGAFEDCAFLESVTIPNSVTKIGAKAFKGDEVLESVTMSDNVTSFGEEVFERTAYYKNSANWENGILYAGSVLIASSSERPSNGFTIKAGTKIIADKAFYSRHLKYGDEIVIPDSVIYIGNYAFQMCYGMNGVTLGKGVTSIGKSAFEGCVDLNIITIDRTVTSIGEDAFKDCALNSIYHT